MPREIITTDGRTFRFREYQLPPPGPAEVRVRVEFAAPKHGTEAHVLGGSAFDEKQWDPDLRLFRPRPEEVPPRSGARTVGNMVVGTVAAVGGEVIGFRAGQRVFGYGPIREEHQADQGRWYPLGDLSSADAVCTDPAHVAFVAARDGNVRIGDDVAVFGLGAIGLLTVQIARASGAARVFAVDPLAHRRRQALEHGADRALDPTAEDVGLEIKLNTERKGVDVALETSGSGAALHEAIRCLRQCGTVVHVPWGPRDAAALRLDQEFHLNRPTIIGSQAVWENPDRDHPRWTERRARLAVIDLFRREVLTGEEIVTPIVRFDRAADALAETLQHPERGIKLGVLFE
jgi:threonine dehydrogenase-like Zn-dependent dehydrogenase